MLGKSFHVRQLSELDEPGDSLQSGQGSTLVNRSGFFDIVDEPVLTANRASILPLCPYGWLQFPEEVPHVFV